MTSTAPYDYVDSLRRMGNDECLFQEMVGFLRADGPRWLRMLHAALQEGDYAVAERSAHCLKGLAANFAAVRAVSAAEVVERLAGEGQTPDLLPQGSQGGDLASALAELERALDELLEALPRSAPVTEIPAPAPDDVAAPSAPLAAGVTAPP